MKLFFFSFLISLNLFASQVFIGDTVIDSANEIGLVKKVFNNGKVVVNIRGYDLVRMENELSPSVLCYQKFCVEGLVASRPDYGTATQVFANGKVQFTSIANNYIKIREARELSVSVVCYRGACEGDAVIDAANSQGSVLHIFDDGYALVNFPSHGNYFRAISELGY